MTSHDQRAVWSRLFLFAVVTAILVPTLAPAPPSYAAIPTFCLVCGEQGVADTIANIVLFVPLGIALALQRWRLSSQVLFAAALTLAIESSQSTLIPGRDASLGDLLFNTVGALVGIALARSSATWLTPGALTRRVLEVGASVFIAAVVVLTGVLTHPQLDAPRYRSQWAQRLTGSDWYRGTLQSVSIGGRTLPEGILDEQNALRDSVMSGAPVRVRGIAGPRPLGFAPILTIRAQRNQEVFMIGQSDDDLVFRYRPQAEKLLLRTPDHRWRGAMRVFDSGDALQLDVRYTPPGFTIATGETTTSVAFRARDGWRLLLPTFGPIPWLRSVIDYVWMACLFFPLGLWTSRSSTTVISGIIVGGAFVAVGAARLLGLPGVPEVVGAVIGWSAGYLVRQLATTWRPHATSALIQRIVARTA